MAYTARQYAAQDYIMAQVRGSNLTGRCPVCNVRPCRVWPDGVPRITCGHDACYTAWLNIHPAQHEEAAPGQQNTYSQQIEESESLSAQTQPEEPTSFPESSSVSREVFQEYSEVSLFTVSLVTGRSSESRRTSGLKRRKS